MPGLSSPASYCSVSDFKRVHVQRRASTDEGTRIQTKLTGDESVLGSRVCTAMNKPIVVGGGHYLKSRASAEFIV